MTTLACTQNQKTAHAKRIGIPRIVAGVSPGKGLTKCKPGPVPINVAKKNIAERTMLNRVLDMEKIQ
ncbi:MAG: hypothetical protein CMI31_14515 [Opitutae bacterium]|nr:hypothetical protein [Opitutae bacterium]|tara:strand:+ start:1199 stop:1399 length:201 start_codon:yes stop_codon:yes gene_type:complete